MNDIITKLKSQATSPLDIFKIAGKQCNVFSYGYLKDIHDVDDLFVRGMSEFNVESPLEFDEDTCIILYKSEPNFGHWTILKRVDDQYHYLDSYGKVMDNPLHYSDNKKLGQQRKVLPKLLLNSGAEVYYNHIPLQELSTDIATCGLYCALYLKYDLPVDLFSNLIKNVAKMLKISNDDVVVMLSYF